MPSVLRPVPVGDPRPSSFAPAVLEAAVRSNGKAICDWVKRHRYENTVAEPSLYPDIDDAILFVVADVVDRSLGDPAKASRLLEAVYGWEANDKLAWHLEVVRRNLEPAKKLAVMRWVLRTGMRFPGRRHDLILFYDDTGVIRKGRVQSLDLPLARATVKGENGTESTVNAEMVRENISLGLMPPKVAALRS